MSPDPAAATGSPPREILIGSEIPVAGSWNWLGQDLIGEWTTSEQFQIRPFSLELPRGDVFVFIKWLASLRELRTSIADRWGQILSEVLVERGMT